MWSGFPLFPEQASTFASRVDTLYFFMLALSVFFSLLIATLVVFFAVRYRRRSSGELPRPIHGSLALELTWTFIPLGLVLFIFLWSADLFVFAHRPPPGAMDVYVVGKRWMWKTQHMTGQREINELHVPVGIPVKLTLTSEDVIHSFFIPAFRVKQDAVPGMFTTIWFEATRPGRYHLFCAEYCGTKHSAMIGQIVVMEPAAFQTWLAGGAMGSPAAEGQKLFEMLACNTCHRGDAQGRGPRLEGLFGRPVSLADGSTVVANADYVRESIVSPSAKVAAGYQPIMPTFQGLVTEEGLMQLVAYIQSLQSPTAEGPVTIAPSERTAADKTPQRGRAEPTPHRSPR
jgi:cytochrome c oxidase subunit II